MVGKGVELDLGCYVQRVLGNVKDGKRIVYFK